MKDFFQNNKRLLSKMVIFAMLLSLCSGAGAPARVKAEEATVTITSQPEDVTVTAGNITEKLTVAATTTATGGALSFQWYNCEDAAGKNAAEEEGATEATFAIPADLEAGEYYYYCEVGAEDVEAVQSDVATVTVENAVAVVEEGTPTLTYEVVGGTGSMDPEELTVGETVTLLAPEFTADANREFFGWLVYDQNNDMVAQGYLNNTKFEVKEGSTYTAIAYYGYEVTIEDLPEDARVMYGSALVGNEKQIVVPEFTDAMMEANAFMISSSSLTSAPSFIGENATAELIQTSDGSYLYVIKDITGPVTLTLVAQSEPNYNLTYEVVGGTGSMDPEELTVGETVTLLAPEFTADANREFFGWLVYDQNNDMVAQGYLNNTKFEVKEGSTYTAIAYYGYEVTIEDLPEDARVMYGSALVGNEKQIVVPEFTDAMMEANAFMISSSSLTSAPSFIGENATAELIQTSDGSYLYVIKDITGPVTLTLVPAPEVSGNIELKENVTITRLEANKYEVSGLEEEEGFTWVYNLGSVNEGQDVNEKVAFELAGWLSSPKDQYVELKKVWGVDDEPYIISGTFLRQPIDDFGYVQIFKLDAAENVHAVAVLALPKVEEPEETYTVTFDTSNFTGDVLYSLGSEDIIEVTDGLEVTVSVGGSVFVLSENNFKVTVTGEATIGDVTAGVYYMYEISNIQGDITIAVEPVAPAATPATYNYTELYDGQIIYPGDILVNNLSSNSVNINILDRNYTYYASIASNSSMTFENSYAYGENYSIESDTWKVMKTENKVYFVKEADAHWMQLITDEFGGVSRTEDKDNYTITVNREEGYRYFYKVIMDAYATLYPEGQTYTNEMLQGVPGAFNPTVSSEVQRTYAMDEILEEGGFTEMTKDSFCVESSVYGVVYKFQKDTDVAGKTDNHLLIGAVCFAAEKIARDVTVTDTVNGTVTATVNGAPATKVEEVETVCLTLTPEDGYKVNTVSVKDAKGNEIFVEEDGSFLMPRSAVTITVTFAEAAPEEPTTPTPTEYNASKIKVGDRLFKGDTIIGDISNAYVWFCRYEYEQGVAVLDEYVIQNELGDDVADAVWAKGWEVFDVVAEDEEGRYSILLRAEDENGIYTKLVAPEVSVEKNTAGAYELSIQEESGYTYYYNYMPLGVDLGDGYILTYEEALESAEWMLAEEFKKAKSLYNEKEKAPSGDVYKEAVTFGETGGVIMVLKYLDTEDRWIEAGMNIFVAGEASEGGGSGFISSFDVQFDWNKVPQLEVGMDESTVPYFESAPATAKGTGIVEDIYYGWAIKVDESFKLTQEEADELGIDSSGMANYNSDIDDYITNWGSWAMLDLLLDYGYKVNEDDIYSVFVTVNAKNGYNFGEEGKVYTGTINSNVEVGTCISADFYAVSFFKLGTIADIEQEKENAGGSTPTPDTPTPKEYNVSDIKVGDRLFAGDTINGDISNAYVWFCRYEYEQGVAVLDEYVIQNELGDDVADEVWAKGWEVFDVVAEDEEGRYSILLRAEDETGIYTKLVEPEVSVQKNEAGVYELSIQEEIGYTYYYMFAPLGTDLGEGYIMTYEAALEEAERILEDKLPKYKSLYNEMEGAPNGDIYGAKVNFGETGALVMVLKYLDDEERWIETGMTALVAGEATPVHEHVWSEKWSKDATYHWHECEGTVGTCDITANADKNGYGRHAYSNSSDRFCDTCGYERSVYIPPYVPETTPDPTPVPTAVPTPVPTATPIPGVVTLPTMDETVVDKSGKEVTSLVQDAGTTNKLEIAGITDQPGAVVTYTSTNTNAVEVDAAGNVTMKNPGMSEITITVGEGENAKQETIVVVVEEPPMYVNDEEEAIKNIRLGTSANDIPLVRYQEPGQTIDINFWGVKNWMKDKYEYVWNTSDSSVAVTDSLGKVTALKPGVVTMTLGLKNKQTGKMLNVKSIEVVIPEDSGEKILLGTSQNSIFDSLTLRPEDRVDINFYGVKNWKKEDYEYRWISSEPTTVWVDKVGKVTPVKPGSATITLVLIDKKTGFPKYVVPTTVTILDKDVK